MGAARYLDNEQKSSRLAILQMEPRTVLVLTFLTGGKIQKRERSRDWELYLGANELRWIAEDGTIDVKIYDEKRRHNRCNAHYFLMAG